MEISVIRDTQMQLQIDRPEATIPIEQFDGAVIEHSDNLEFMSKFPDGHFQMIVTSPPYNLGKKYESRRSLADYLSMQANVIAESVRLLDQHGSLCWQVGNFVSNGEIVPLDMAMYPLFREHGLKLRNRIIWHFGHGLHSTRRLSGRYEVILWFTKTDDYVFNLDPIRVPAKYPGKKHYKGPNKGKLSGNPLGKNPTDVWEIPNVKSNHVEKTDHPCQFPVELIERLVLSLTSPGDRVLDPYLGVGSSVLAAEKHGRRGYGCDIDVDYIAQAKNRYNELIEGTLKTRPMNRPVYDPSLPNGGHR